MLFILYTFFINSVYLFRSHQKLHYKFQITLRYFLLTLILPLSSALEIKSIKIFNFRLEGFDFITLYLLFGEVFVRNEYYFKLKHPKPIIIDCGSNIGYSIIFFKYLYPGSIIYAFEADTKTFEMLKRNIERNNLKGVHLYNAAITDYDGEAVFYISETPGGLRNSLIKERMSEKEIKVKAVRLSEFIKDKKVDFMKMDIEGYETIALGDLMENKLLSNITEMIIEYHHNIRPQEPSLSTLLSWLDNCGFRYQLDTSCIPIYSKNSFQDILIYAYRQK